MKKLLKKIKKASEGIDFNERTSYIAVCQMSMQMIKQWDDEPSFLRGEKPKQFVWLIPEISHKMDNKAEETAKQLQKKLGNDFDVRVCPTKNDILMMFDNYITL